jgi:hypothetical protein
MVSTAYLARLLPSSAKHCQALWVSEQELSLADLGKDFPTGHLWIGVSAELYYARRPRSSPPIVLRAEGVEALRKQLEAWHADQRRPK